MAAGKTIWEQIKKLPGAGEVVESVFLSMMEETANPARSLHLIAEKFYDSRRKKIIDIFGKESMLLISGKQHIDFQITGDGEDLMIVMWDPEKHRVDVVIELDEREDSSDYSGYFEDIAFWKIVNYARDVKEGRMTLKDVIKSLELKEG